MTPCMSLRISDCVKDHEHAYKENLTVGIKAHGYSLTLKSLFKHAYYDFLSVYAMMSF